MADQKCSFFYAKIRNIIKAKIMNNKTMLKRIEIIK